MLGENLMEGAWFWKAPIQTVAVLRGGGGGGGREGRTPPPPPPPPKPPGGRHAMLTRHRYSKPYVDQEMDIKTFYVTQDGEKPTDSA